MRKAFSSQVKRTAKAVVAMHGNMSPDSQATTIPAQSLVGNSSKLDYPASKAPHGNFIQDSPTSKQYVPLDFAIKLPVQATATSLLFAPMDQNTHRFSANDTQKAGAPPTTTFDDVYKLVVIQYPRAKLSVLEISYLQQMFDGIKNDAVVPTDTTQIKTFLQSLDKYAASTAPEGSIITKLQAQININIVNRYCDRKAGVERFRLDMAVENTVEGLKKINTEILSLEQKEALSNKIKTIAATKIQTFVRKHQAQKSFKDTKNKIIIAQSVVRRKLAQQHVDAINRANDLASQESPALEPVNPTGETAHPTSSSWGRLSTLAVFGLSALAAVRQGLTRYNGQPVSANLVLSHALDNHSSLSPLPWGNLSDSDSYPSFESHFESLGTASDNNTSTNDEDSDWQFDFPINTSTSVTSPEFVYSSPYTKEDMPAWHWSYPLPDDTSNQVGNWSDFQYTPSPTDEDTLPICELETAPSSDDSNNASHMPLVSDTPPYGLTTSREAMGSFIFTSPLANPNPSLLVTSYDVSYNAGLPSSSYALSVWRAPQKRDSSEHVQSQSLMNHASQDKPIAGLKAKNSQCTVTFASDGYQSVFNLSPSQVVLCGQFFSRFISDPNNRLVPLPHSPLTSHYDQTITLELSTGDTSSVSYEIGMSIEKLNALYDTYQSFLKAHHSRSLPYISDSQAPQQLPTRAYANRPSSPPIPYAFLWQIDQWLLASSSMRMINGSYITLMQNKTTEPVGLDEETSHPASNAAAGTPQPANTSDKTPQPDLNATLASSQKAYYGLLCLLIFAGMLAQKSHPIKTMIDASVQTDEDTETETIIPPLVSTEQNYEALAQQVAVLTEQVRLLTINHQESKSMLAALQTALTSLIELMSSQRVENSSRIHQLQREIRTLSDELQLLQPLSSERTKQRAQPDPAVLSVMQQILKQLNQLKHAMEAGHSNKSSATASTQTFFKPSKNVRTSPKSIINPELSPTGATNSEFLSMNGGAGVISPDETLQKRTPSSSRIIFAHLDGGLNDATSGSQYEHGSLFKPIEPTDSTTIASDSEYLITINYPTHELTAEQKEELNNEGLNVSSPAGIPYRLIDKPDTAPCAILREEDAQPIDDKESEQDHQQRLAVTVMNMIDNVASSSRKINIKTSDPFIKAIADKYLDYLNTMEGIALTKNIAYTGPTDTGSSVKENSAAACFKKLSPQLTKSRETNPAWKAIARYQINNTLPPAVMETDDMSSDSEEEIEMPSAPIYRN